MHTLPKKNEKGKTQDQSTPGTKFFNLFLRISPEVRKGLRMYAAANECSMQQAGVLAVTEFVERNKV